MPGISDLFKLDVNAVDLVVRASVIYLVLLIALRVLGRREMGTLALPDLLVLVLIADGVSNGLGGQYSSVTAALIVGGTLVSWNYILDLLSYRIPTVRRLLEPPPLTVIADGRFLTRNMRKEYLSEEEVRRHLRAEGVEDPRAVKRACLEPDGRLSVILFDEKKDAPHPPPEKHVPT